MTERVLVIDPGERVGWAKAVITDGEITEVTQGVHHLKDFALALGKGAENYGHIIYETWRLRPDMAKKMVGNDFQPVQLIGIIRYCSWLHPSIQLHSLGPSTKTTGRKVMPQILSERLSHSTEEHDRDALDLLSYWWFKRYA